MEALFLRRGGRTVASRLHCSRGARRRHLWTQALFGVGDPESDLDFEDITRKNFWQALGLFKAHLELADFVAIDLELSGVHCSSPQPSPLQPSDSSALHVERCYSRLRHLAEKFAVLQVGVSLFQQQATNKFIAHPYNFYVFPRNELSLKLPAETFSCETSSLEFLASHGFNFNLCIQDGVSYLSKAQEAEARLTLLGDHVSHSNHHCECVKTTSSTTDIIFSERVRVELAKWKRRLKESIDNFDCLKTFGNICTFTAAKGFEIRAPPFRVSINASRNPYFVLRLESHHQVCLSRRVLETHFEDLVPIVKSDCTSGVYHEITILLARSREESYTLKEELQHNDQSKEVLINEAIGFRHVVDAIASSKKLVVGHNCALDLAHLHSKFISPLPASFEEFSASLLAHFPSIFDTKYLMKTDPKLRPTWARKHTSLGAVYTDLCKPKEVSFGGMRYARNANKLSQAVQIEIMHGFKRYLDRDLRFLHEAGYDAFMTGSVFAQICHLLNTDVKNLGSLTLGKAAIEEHVNLLSVGNVKLELKPAKLKGFETPPKSQEISSS